ncbi:MAG: hypothetical protein J0H18_08635, partial [Rhizobiales bacterium]|nr:hypothetical protein [Hyphomicrobiales bacterium]
MRKPTLTWSLFIRVAPTILVTVLAIGWLAFRSATQEIHYVYDARMIDDANTLWNLLQKPLLKYDFVPPRRFRDLDLTMGNQLSLNDYADDYADAEMFRLEAQVRWLDSVESRLAGLSSGVPAEPPAPPRVLPRRRAR